MAESIVSLVVERIGDLLIHEAASLYGVEGEVQRLQAQLEFMQGFLKDADVKQNQGERIRILIAQIRDVAYDADDIIDAFILKVARRGEMSGLINKFTSIFTKGSHLHEINSQIQSIRTRIADIFNSLQLCGIQFVGEGEGSSSRSEMQRQLRRSYAHYSEGEDDIILEDSKRNLKDQLMKEDERLRVVSVVGMGGIGKTTLANQVYNDVKQHFDCHAWVYVSDQFATMDVLPIILSKVTSKRQQEDIERKKEQESVERRDKKGMTEQEDIGKMKEQQLVETLQIVLKEKRYLVVLDDIWRTEAWDSLKHAFPDGKKGSKVLLTTRTKDVALYADQRSSPIEPPLLSPEQGWKLLRKKAFPRDIDGEHACTHEFENLGKDMVEKCGRLPLAIVVLGGLLAKKTLQEWEVVHRNISANLKKFEQNHYGGVYNILALSYHDLPYHLKPCFLHFANFPEDWEIHKRRLIRMWIAEGFIPLPLEGEGEETMEDVAEQYLEELINRCMIQVGQRDHTGRGVKTCRMHDLMRDICMEKAKKENFLGIIQQQGSSTATGSSFNMHLTTAKSRRIAIHDHSCDIDYSELLEQGQPHIRSLSFFIMGDEYKSPKVNGHSIYKNFKLLRVLHLEKVWNSSSRAIFNLMHLRYLVLKGQLHNYISRKDYLSSLPMSIDNLRSLNTLDLRDSGIYSLPNSLGKLECLRHLLVDKDTEGPNRIDSLRNLETLKWIKAKHLIKNDAVLKLTNLRNLKMELERLEEVEMVLKSPILGRLRSLCMCTLFRDASSYDLKPLSQCRLLSKLEIKLEITGMTPEDPRGISEEIPEDPCWSHHNLEYLPKNLVKFTLIGSCLRQDPMAVLKNLPNLRFLFLGEYSYVGSEMVCSAHGFPQLEILILERLLNLEEWRVEEGAMPCLKSLHIEWLDNFRMIPEGLKFVTTLQELTLDYMPTTFKNRVRVVDGVEGEDFYKVRHIPSIRFW